MLRIVLNKWTEKWKKLSIKVSKWLFICLNLVAIVAAIYVFKSVWKVLSAQQQELIRQRLLKNREQPIEELLSTVITRKAVLVTLVVTAVTVAVIGLIGSFKHNSCLIAAHLIFCVTVATILALGYRNYANYSVNYALVLSFIVFTSIVSSVLMHVLKEEPHWVKRKALLMSSRDSF